MGREGSQGEVCAILGYKTTDTSNVNSCDQEYRFNVLGFIPGPRG